MQAMALKVLGLLGNILGGWLLNTIMNRKFLEWAILYCAKKLVAKTETKHDDEFLAKIEEAIKQVPQEIK